MQDDSGRSATLESFFCELARASERLLMLDYDGTLAPFVVARDRAVPYPGVRPLLVELLARKKTRLVVVSGRSVADLLPLLGLDPAPEIWGCHGWERRLVSGELLPPELPEQARHGLDRARLVAIESGWQERLELKPASLALHWRGVGEAERRRLQRDAEDSWGLIADRSMLELHPFSGGLELRCPGRDKGTVVNGLLEGFAGLAAYLGDDLTDEDAFRALEGRGLRVLVRAGSRETAADLRLGPPEQLLDFLRRWVDCDSAGGC